ncbi:MAG: hydrogenase maturation nickel metallochaperone HypA [Candidatus Omnitrophica bacterium]|nr:hydrogenase maturation nickel metallochaperone HypA [Candidatus Omnitrophota bacterium]
MHETHLIQPIIDGISEHAQKEGAKKVSKIRLKVGEFTGSKEDSFKETFAVLAKGTIMEDAQLELTFFPGTRVEVVSFDIE